MRRLIRTTATTISPPPPLPPSNAHAARPGSPPGIPCCCGSAGHAVRIRPITRPSPSAGGVDSARPYIRSLGERNDPGKPATTTRKQSEATYWGLSGEWAGSSSRILRVTVIPMLSRTDSMRPLCSSR